MKRKSNPFLVATQIKKTSQWQKLKRVSNIDIKAFQRKAKKYVKEKNFSDEANEQMRLYNLAMKVNRLELLKANIGLELVAGHDELKSYTGQKLEGAYLEEIKRNASILGDTVIDNAKTAKTVADSSFKNATFSERIWVNQDQLKTVYPVFYPMH